MLGALLLRGLFASNICSYQGAIFFQWGYHMKAVCQISVANAVVEVEFLIYKVGMEYASYNKNCLLTRRTTVKSDWKRWHILYTFFKIVLPLVTSLLSVNYIGLAVEAKCVGLCSDLHTKRITTNTICSKAVCEPTGVPA